MLLGSLCQAPAARAGDPTPRFSIAEGRPWVSTPDTTVGDAGWTPYSVPGVVVWDGGSIMGSFGIAPGRGFAEQTLARVPHSCKLYLSAVPGADIGDMRDEAPVEVDGRFVDAADADVCVVQAGGGDLKHHAPVDEVFAGVRRYCLDRRAAGFKVVILTLLPRSDVPAFNAARDQFNTLLRKKWPSFADGLVDVAADHRIGDIGDNLDTRYYRKDQKHPSAKGCAVLASLAAPVLRSLEWRTSSVEVRLRNGDGEWSEWRPHAPQMTWSLEPGDGAKAVECEYRTASGEPISARDQASLDSVRPTVAALGRPVAAAGSPIRLAFRVDDRQPCADAVSVTLRVLLHGRVVRQAVRPNVAIGVRHVSSFGWDLAPGRYSWQVRARDGAGNPQISIGTGTLTVR